MACISKYMPCFFAPDSQELTNEPKISYSFGFQAIAKEMLFSGYSACFSLNPFPATRKRKKRCRSLIGTTASALFFVFNLSSAQLSWLVFGSICVVLFHIRVLPAVFSVLRRRLSNAADAATHSGAWFRETVSPQGRKI